jgi:iron complex transport system substrate-binding protein
VRSASWLALLALVGLAACSRSSAPGAAPAEAKRIVSLGPATTEALYAVGAGDRVVGRSRYDDYPPEVAKVPAVGGIEPDVEAILELHPDLVVGPSGHWSAGLAQTMHAHGIATWFPEENGSLAEVDALVVGVGTRAGHAADAARVVEALHAREAAVERAVAAAPKPRVLVVVGTTPVVVAVGPASFADELLRRAGARNAVTAGGGWPTLDMEHVVELDPDVVVDATVAETGGETHITPDATGWKGLRAVREGHVVPLRDPRVLRPGPRVAEGLAVLAHALHPDVPVP